MKKLYLHIGPHKTGSTYIQKTLFDSREQLKSKGLNYPQDLIGPQWGHHKLVEAIKDKNSNTIVKMLSGFSDKTLVSSENFENLTEQNIKYFFSFLEEFEVVLIFVKRSFSELLISNWQESVKHGSATPWASFLLDQVLRPYSSVILNQISTVERWELFCNQIEVIDYDVLKSTNIDIVDYILDSVLSIKDFKISTGKHINASMNYCDIELIRILNGFHLKDVGATGTQVRDMYLKLKAEKEVLIDKILVIINDYLIDLTPSTGWGISHFESTFRNKYQKSRQVQNPNNRTYMLPSPDMFYLFSIQEDTKKLYELVKRGIR